jgi:hypothetical protein
VKLTDLKRLAQEVELSDNEEELKEFYRKWYLIKHNLRSLKASTMQESSIPQS